MNDFRLSVLKPRYEELFASCRIRSSWLEQIVQIAQGVVNRRSLYNQVEAQTSVPWWFVGILHYRELNFQDVPLPNGGSLNSQTWVESVVAALREKKFDTAKDRSIPAWLWRFEIWSGFGYTAMGLNSEYLWNGTNHFGSGNNRGKFLANGSYDPNAQSEQVGAATILWYLYHQGLVTDTPQTAGTPAFAGVAAIPVGTTPANITVQQVQAPNVLTTNVQTQAPIQLLDVLRYYQKLPHQDLALTWLQQQLPANLLEELAQRWRTNPNPGVMPMSQPSVVPPVTTTPAETSSKSLNQAILDAALGLRGMSTAEGPDGGNKACAWTLNRILKKAGIQPLGDNPNYVPSLVQALKGGRGQLVSRNEAQAGDLVVSHREAHVGVGLTDGCKRVLSNSSSRAKLVWESGTDFDGYYGGASTIYRLIK